jgi:hypothetical protein
MLTTHIHIEPRLRMSGAILLLSLYAFMAWTGDTILYFILLLDLFIFYDYCTLFYTYCT